VVTLEPEPWLDVELDCFEEEPLEDPLEDEPLEDEPVDEVELPVEEEPVVRLVLACCVEPAEVVAPSDPVPAISPKAIAKVAIAAATTRRRSTRARRARARSRSRTRSRFEVGGGVEVMAAG
jgi:hypothetical protein